MRTNAIYLCLWVGFFLTNIDVVMFQRLPAAPSPFFA
jgi:hypothetical protein